ncbi:MAG: hypothetical protein HY829_10615 [Actinobacteria bacterium]|nr:hypothetical protein [Actinomycetota bacterium]
MADNDSTFLCPRRDEVLNPDGPFKVPNHDEWHGKDPRRTCSWCGSMHPDDFLAAIRAGVTVGPTDKSYKAYVEETLNDPDRVALGERYKAQGFTREHATDLAKHASGAHIGKFYYRHLSEEQQGEFIGLLNAKAVHVGYPGHFYVLPFFVKVKAAE